VLPAPSPYLVTYNVFSGMFNPAESNPKDVQSHDAEIIALIVLLCRQLSYVKGRPTSMPVTLSCSVQPRSGPKRDISIALETWYLDLATAWFQSAACQPRASNPFTCLCHNVARIPPLSPAVQRYLHAAGTSNDRTKERLVSSAGDVLCLMNLFIG